MRSPRHSTIVAYLALFVALGGTAGAAVTLRANSITSREIRNGSVTRADLAPSIRPTAATFRAAVTDIVTDPATGIHISVTGEKGDKGDPGQAVAGPAGPQGASVQGPQGPGGSSGPQGAPGDVRAFGHVRPDGSGTAQGVTVTHPGLGVYCVNGTASGVSFLSVTPDASNSQAFVIEANAQSNSCPVDRLEVVVSNNGGVDTGFYFVGS
jgi:hypothetical protein